MFSLVAYKKARLSSLKQEGAHFAASNRDNNFSSSTGVDANALGDHLSIKI